MHLSADAARQHVDYTIWASGRLLAAAAQLPRQQLQHDFGTADKSIFGTLLHLMKSETMWLRRLRGNSDPSGLPNPENLEQLAEAWGKTHQDWRDFASHLNDAELEQPVSYHDLKGKPWTNTLWEIWLHVVNHSTHHRGQVSGFLRTSGTTPPPLDYIAFVRAKG